MKVKIPACIALSLLQLIVSSVATAEDNLVGYWRFENTLNDVSGNGGTATPTGGPVYTAGKFGRAFSLNGASDANVVTSATLKRPFTNGAITMSAWAKVDTWTTGFIAFYGSTGGAFCASALIEVSPGQEISAKIQELAVGEESVTSSALTAGTWYHVAWTFANGGTMRLYIDGVEVASVVPSITLNSAAQIFNFKLGSNVATGNSGAVNCGGGPFYFDGSMDELRVYDRVLSAAEIRQLMLNYGPGGR
jgi:hypothetical protein